jgi:glycosyltransferase involved in cell wall biosynthesis
VVKKTKFVLDFGCMTKMISELSVFLPAFNEEENTERTVLYTKNVLGKVAEKWELIIVDDGSKDRTGEIADKLSKKYSPNVRAIHNNPNRGYGGALQSGLYASKYDWIAFTDIDGQFDFSEITKFIEKQKETNADLVIGYYKKRQVSKSVIITSKIWELIVFILFGLHVKDIDCGFKLLSKRVIKKIPHLQSERGAFISSELLIKSKKFGFKIVEIPVTHLPRKSGKPTGRNIKVIINSFIDLISLWKKLM